MRICYKSTDFLDDQVSLVRNNLTLKTLTPIALHNYLSVPQLIEGAWTI